MAEEKIIIEINPDGSMKAKTEGFEGDICIAELQKILGKTELCDIKPSDDFYQETKTVQMRKKTIKRD